MTVRTDVETVLRGLHDSTLRERARLFIRALVACGLFALNLEPTNEAIGRPVAILIALAAPFDGVAFCLLSAGSQVVADAKGLPVTLAQLAAAGWLLTLPFTGWMAGRASARAFAVVLVPLLLWVLPVLLGNGTFDLLGFDLLAAIAIGGIVAGYAGSADAKPPQLLIGLLVGAGLGVMGYWGREIGAPVIAPTYDPSSSRPVFRIGSGRGDANTIGLNLPVSLWGLVTLILTQQGPKKVGIGIVAGVLALLAIFVPPTIATGSRTALYQLAIGGALTAIVVGKYVLVRSDVRRRVALVFLLVPIALIGMQRRGGTQMEEYIDSVVEVTADQSDGSILGSMVSGRSNAWGVHLSILREFPLSGVPAGTSWDFGEYGTAVIGGEGIVGAAHNTFLEFGSMSGLPGLLLFLGTALAPFALLRRRRRRPLVYAFAVSYATMLIGMSGLSVPGWKTFWAMFALGIVGLGSSKEAGHS